MIAILCLSATTAMAEDSGIEVGVSTGKIGKTINISSNGYGNLVSESNSESVKTLSVGKYLTDGDIIVFAKSFVDTEIDEDIDMMSFAYRRLIDIESKSNIKLFAGGTWTKLSYKATGLKASSAKYHSDSVSWDTKIISLDFGVRVAEIAKNLSIDVGYSLGLSHSGSGSIGYDTVDLKVKYDKYKHWYIGLNYKF